ncbi:MAG: ThiF family adenylyltransferase, partial [Thiohalobacterales bacterium]
MDDQQLLRYSRQIMLPQVDINGQEQLLAAHALIVGAGGLGSPAAIYLAAAGIGKLSIADDDVVELSNLQRQILHHDTDIGKHKTASAREALASINPEVRVTALPERLQGERLDIAVEQVDVVLDCSDNFATRFAVNAACVNHATPLVSGAAVRLEGQLAVFLPGQGNSPCYSCLYREGEEEDQTCSGNGVLAPVVGIIGSMQALEAIKVILALGETLSGRLVVFDGMTHEWRTLTIARDPDCPVCG